MGVFSFGIKHFAPQAFIGSSWGCSPIASSKSWNDWWSLKESVLADGVYLVQYKIFFYSWPPFSCLESCLNTTTPLNCQVLWSFPRFSDKTLFFFHSRTAQNWHKNGQKIALFSMPDTTTAAAAAVTKLRSQATSMYIMSSFWEYQSAELNKKIPSQWAIFE